MSESPMVLLGAGGSNDAQRLQDLELLVGQLLRSAQSGNISGGIIHANIGPGAWTQGPYRMDVDASFSLKMDIWIPDFMLRLKRCILRLHPGASRLAGSLTSGASTASTTGASSATTTQEEGDTPVNVETAGHVHQWATRLNATASVVGTSVDKAGGGTVVVPTVADFDQYRTYDSVGGATQSMDMLTVSTFFTHYTAVSAGGTVSVTPSGHTHDMPHNHNMAHTHDVGLSISESGAATGLHVKLDAVDRTTALSGPWSADVVLDITAYLVNASQEPIVGAHPLEVTSTAAGSIEVCLDFYGVIKPPA